MLLRRCILAVLVLLTSPLSFAEASDASFDCSKAAAPVEHVICHNDALAARDGQMADLFRDILRLVEGDRRSGLVQEQRTWLRTRLQRCQIPDSGKSKAQIPSGAARCLYDTYEEHLTLLRREIPDLKAIEKVPRSQGVEVVGAIPVGKSHVSPGIITADQVRPFMDVPIFQPPILVPPDGNWMEHGTDATNCGKWFSLIEQGWRPPDFHPDDSFAEAAGTTCEILRRLTSGVAAKVSYLPANEMGDIRLYSPHLLRCLYAWQCNDIDSVVKCAPTFAALEGRDCNVIIVNRESGAHGDIVVTAHNHYYLEFEYQDVAYRLSIVARGDFTGDGIEDFLAEFIYGPTREALGSGIGTGLGGVAFMILTRLPGQDAIAPVSCLGSPAICQEP